MTIPGFSAALCLNDASTAYGALSRRRGPEIAGGVMPAIPISDDEWFQMCRLLGCGAITRPDGTRDCVCDHNVTDSGQEVVLEA